MSGGALSGGRSGVALSASKVSKAIGDSRTHRSRKNRQRGTHRTTRMRSRSVEFESAFGQVIQSSPKDAVDDDDEKRHHQNAEIDRRLIAFFGHLRYVGAQAIGNELVVSPGSDLGHDARI